MSDKVLNRIHTFKYPSTRYRGSKRKIIEWIEFHIQDLKFDNALDAFGGTGVVSYMMKKLNKEVTYNDYLKFNYHIGHSVIENSFDKVTIEEISNLLKVKDQPLENNFIKENFKDIFYLEAENAWLDQIIFNIKNEYSEKDSYKKSVCYNALFQACLVKRPYNLFHRNNLNLRTADVVRSFGNKTSWDSSFESQFARFVAEINSSVFNNNRTCKATHKNIFDISNNEYELVYLDPPYFSEKSAKESAEYINMYHFLEGLCNYDIWNTLINYKTKNKSLIINEQHELNKENICFSLEEIIKKFKESIIVISYKNNGIPSVKEIENILHGYKKNVKVSMIDYKYALNKVRQNEEPVNEVLFIAS